MAEALRPLRFAGTFFPAGAKALRGEVARHLSGAEGATAGAMPRAIVAAHAGYRYSGRFAGLSHGVAPARPGRIAILSPSRRLAFRGIAFPTQAGFATPLGDLPIDRAACETLAQAGLARALDAAHDDEHGIETQLPFLAHLWPGVPVVPLVIGDASAAEVAAVIDALDDCDTFFVLSSDLSHFLDDRAARKRDAETAAMIERAETGRLDGAHACGARAIAGWLISRAGRASKPLRLAMGNSGAASGDMARVVGYGAWAFFPLNAPMLGEGARATLLRTARQAIEIRLRTGKDPAIAADTFAPQLATEAASFVTLTQDGRLRGCVGSLAPQRPLFSDVAANAQKAALSDPRFPPLPREDLAGARLKIAVLSRPAPLDFADEADALARITPGQDGLILTSGRNRGTFLPQVWEQLPDPAQFLRALKRKAGLPEDHWSPGLTLDRFRAESFAEDCA
ncbi:AmmeMemoRadiSam system protein A [Rhodovulum marinum]|uniref:AMMECR1 domain-containing protein n=1 Tax=Rhodovulum marinum TaxID=320662 RepID=A0A4R2Q8C3_9RHOB|nr:AmmeMemoRadiSam system protein A [Rhodovulum marinum]TCP44314.1 hypothetical protein EV662_101406 [Rhodovulum marinum]